VRKNPLIQFVAWSLILSHPVVAQEAIQIEIDSAPVEVEIQKPTETPAEQPQPAEPVQAESAQPADEGQQQADEGGEEGGSRKYAVAIGIGALVAGLLAALGGGGSGGGSSTPQHP
jgi:hypothetical protein